jgi:hypothetical protein
MIAALAAPGSAAALTAPELFVRAQRWDTHEPAGGWIPLASAPRLDYLGGYQIGYRLQESGVANDFQRVALVVTAVPDGRPTQPYNAAPYCVGRAGTPGTIVEAAPELQFEGDGAYAVRVAVGPGTGGPADCLAGPATTGTFRVGARVAPELVGEPVRYRAQALPGDRFSGVRAADPPGGDAEVRCALDATVAADGSVTGRLTAPDPSFPHAAVLESVFPRPGAWSCVARGVTEGLDDDYDPLVFATPWSAPLAITVLSDFRRRPARIAHPGARRPRLTVRAEWPELARGGTATLTLARIRGCRRGGGYRLRRVGRSTGRFGARRARLRIRRPHGPLFLVGRFAFGGTRFLRPGVDPEPLLLRADGARLGFATAGESPACPG